MALFDLAHGKIIQDAAFICVDKVAMMRAEELEAICLKLNDLGFRGTFALAGNRSYECQVVGVPDNVKLSGKR
jgi:hypothetical protein